MTELSAGLLGIGHENTMLDVKMRALDEGTQPKTGIARGITQIVNCHFSNEEPV